MSGNEILGCPAVRDEYIANVFGWRNILREGQGPVRTPARILVVDDVPENLDIVRIRLESQGYEVVTAVDGEDALARARELEPDLVLLDIMMPKLDGISALKILKQDAALRFVPVILLTAKSDTRDVVAGLEAGGDDYLAKPVDQAALMARVRSMLRIKSLHDKVQEQAAVLEQQKDQLAAWNRSLEQRVAEQVAEIERVGRLRRFLPPQIFDLVAAAGQDKLLESHRREVTCVFCDLRGFTAFTATAEPEEVMTVLREYHESLGEIIFRYEGTLERFAGDGILTLFNDPIPCIGHAERAVQMATEMRHQAAALAELWRKRGYELGFGVGIALGYATLGQIGFDRRQEYTAVGSVINLASRLCDEAQSGQILISQRVFAVVERLVEAEHIGDLDLKGFHRPMPTYNVRRWRENLRAHDDAASDSEESLALEPKQRGLRPPMLHEQESKRGTTKIAISYRRSSSDWAALRIFDRLTAHYGRDSVFMDIDSIPFGIDFREHVVTAVRESAVVIAVMGLDWLGVRDHSENRIEEENDPVRIELEAALERGIPIIPVLVDRATMPKVADLPDSLKELAFRNAAQVHAGQDFDQQVDRLIRSIDRIFLARNKD
jgi:adenylate cyclase